MGCWPASHSHDDLFIYIGRTVQQPCHDGRRMVVARSDCSWIAVESQSNRSCNHRMSERSPLMLCVCVRRMSDAMDDHKRLVVDGRRRGRRGRRGDGRGEHGRLRGRVWPATVLPRRRRQRDIQACGLVSILPRQIRRCRRRRLGDDREIVDARSGTVRSWTLSRRR